jgi:hypothetical protein
MNIDRRSILRMFPLAGVALPAAKLLGEEIPVESMEMLPVKQPESQAFRPLFVIKVKVPLSEERLQALRESFASGMKRHGFTDIAAIVIPSYAELDVFSIPVTEGAAKCSE